MAVSMISSDKIDPEPFEADFSVIQPNNNNPMGNIHANNMSTFMRYVYLN